MVPINKMLPPPPLVFPSQYKTPAPNVGGGVAIDIKPYLWGALGLIVLGAVVKKVF